MDASTTLERRQEALPKIGGSFGGFIALVICLSLIIIGCGVATFILLRSHPYGPSQRRRPAHGRTNSAAALTSSHTRGGSQDTVASASAGMKEKLAGMFQATLTLGRARNASHASRGWVQAAADDDWDSGDEMDEERRVGMKAAPHRSVVITPGGSAHTQHSSHSAYDPHRPPIADPYAGDAHEDDTRGFVVVQGYRPMADGQVQPGRNLPRNGDGRGRAPPARADSDDTTLSETATIVPDRSPSPPRALVDAALARFARDGRPPPRVHPRRSPSSASSASSVPQSFHSAQTRMTTFQEDHDDDFEGQIVESPVTSPLTSPRTFEGGTRFREGL